MNNKFLYILIAALSLLFTASCEKQTSQTGLELSADKTEISADGTDEVNFKVYYDGEDVTSDANVCLDSGMCLMPGGEIFAFSTDTPGKYIFIATYQNEHSDPVTITAL